jgi:hypothetical protein
MAAGSGAIALSASSLTDSVPSLGTPAARPVAIFQVGNQALDAGLNAFPGATALHVCSNIITQYSDIATFTLGNYTALAWTGPVAGSPTGRKITLNAIGAGTITGNGSAICWAIIDSGNSRVLATGPLASAVTLTSGHSFSLDAINIHYPQ